MHVTRFFLLLAVLTVSCASIASSTKLIPEALLKFPKKSFAYPVGDVEFVTEKNDWRDKWYNAQDFGENRHLGEDWNKTTGGDTDCGEPVYSSAEGTIIMARDAGPGWGNAVMIEHAATDGTKLRSLYGHLGSIVVSSGSVVRRQQIGTIGNASGRYKCHLHFEMRWSESSMWNDAGAGYSDQHHGWIDPSEFIEKTR